MAKKKRRPADRDSSDAEADDSPALPVKSEPPSVEAKPVHTAKKAKRGLASEDHGSPAAKKAKVMKASKEVSEKPAEAKVVSEDVKIAIEKEALKIIEDGISQPDAQKDGKAFIPREWHAKFKNVLGKYRKFVETSGKYVAVDTAGGNFVVKRIGDAGVREALPPDGKWKRLLNSAWIAYCEAVPKENRDLQKFMDEVPGQKPKMNPSSPKISPSSPKISPSSPKIGPNSPKISPSSPKTSAGVQGAPGAKKKMLKKKKKVLLEI
jgi:hypothetical protein|mmetsp:Transcript_108202/g.170582  ORF Transcript_108202/g.170582 Transcript_108202/m.170582 type:complete len:265 (-) Transcript_108202:64-858(-)|eukprot:CAMPEP_0169102902 /NCGR_PEP_ID=MMETSP1015-20121227/22420_1 /TAXON_ID=342587 /ORGANISM="Karlodinium micrum, Strain CCMP2283" /LENGTH=264 /DNA_ID=CAMNT_0009164045 /DNA_START=55 /DNA_END=849 /DNA_ORIENTATION=+